MSLEQSLTLLVREFEEERLELERNYLSQHQHLIAELEGLKHHSQVKDKEMAHVKKLAKKILEERTEVETFLFEALSHVRKEIEANR